MHRSTPAHLHTHPGNTPPQSTGQVQRLGGGPPGMWSARTPGVEEDCPQISQQRLRTDPGGPKRWHRSLSEANRGDATTLNRKNGHAPPRSARGRPACPRPAGMAGRSATTRETREQESEREAPRMGDDRTTRPRPAKRDASRRNPPHGGGATGRATQWAARGDNLYLFVTRAWGNVNSSIIGGFWARLNRSSSACFPFHRRVLGSGQSFRVRALSVSSVGFGLGSITSIGAQAWGFASARPTRAPICY